MLPTFNNPELLQRALTHSSFANENPDNEAFADNERLEFLGDAILDFVSASWLFETYPTLDEGRLTSVRAALVRVGTLANFARQINMQDVLRLGKGEVDTGGRNRSNILGDAFEALIGALYLDQGVEAAKGFIIPFLQQASAAIVAENLDRDAKSRLQEWSQAELSVTPRYKLAGTEGPDHAKRFRVEVWLGDRVAAIGIGSSKQAAEQMAAQEALASELTLQGKTELEVMRHEPPIMSDAEEVHESSGS